MRLVIALFVLALGLLPSHAQNRPPPPFPAGFEEAQTAFLALPIEDRRAIQNALVFTGDFPGMASGEFGRLTFQAITTFQRRAGMQRPNAILTDAQRRALVDQATRARQALRFQVQTDPRTGARVGLPMIHVETTTPQGPGTRYAARDGRFRLDTLVNPFGDRTLEALHRRLSVPSGSRTVSYQVLRPDFMVVSGANDELRYYTRVVADGDRLVGYTLTWDPDAIEQFDRINIAIANAFEAVPGAAPAVAAPAATQPGGPAGAGSPAGGQQAGPARPAGPAVAAVPSPGQAQPATPAPAATAVLLGAPGIAVVPSAAIRDCRAITLGPGTTARVRSTDQASGLALLDVEGGTPRAPLPVAASTAPDAPLLFLGRTSTGLALSPTTATRGEGDRLEPTVPLQPGQTGGVLVDRAGRVVGIVTGPGRVRVVSIGTIATAVPQRVVPAATLATLTGATPAPDGPARSTGDLAAALAAAVLPVGCQR